MANYRELLRRVKAEIDEVDAQSARELLDTAEPPLLVDVRRRDEWDEGHIPGAIHIPRGSLESRIEKAQPDRDQPDTPYAVRAQDLLHPQFPVPGVPRFVPSFPLPHALDGLSFERQFSLLRAAAGKDDPRAKILYGIALQQLGRPVSAEREFAAAARLAPDDPDARVAAAVGRFEKARPVRAFSVLGPLTRVFPHAQTVRFHLGLLLLWSAQLDQARKQLRLAHDEGPDTVLGRQADRYLEAIGH